MTVNAFKGLCDLRPFALDLMRSYGAETRTVFWKLRLPASLPDVFTALKLGSTTAMMATIISEFFASETAGVGFMIKYSLRVGNQKAVGWAYIVAATILSLALYGAVCLLERHFLRWHVSIRKEKGFYEDEGIDLDILPGGTDVTSEDQVENDVAQIGTAFYSSVLTYQENGSDFINIFQTMQKSPQWLVTKKDSGITSGKDLKGKKVANWFGGRQYEFYAMAQKYGYDPEKDIDWVQQDYTMDQFENDEVDAASAMSYNEYLLLLENGYSEDDLNVIDPNEEGTAMLEDCLFVKKSWAEENEDLLVRFIRATIKGWQYTAEHPEEAGKIVYKEGESATEDHQIAMTKKVVEFVAPDGNTDEIGELDTDALQQTIDLGVQSGLIKKSISLDKSVDSSYWEKAVK